MISDQKATAALRCLRRAGKAPSSPSRVCDVPGSGTMEPMIRHLVSNPCLDACGTVNTGQLVDGAPVYRCPGCDSKWIEIADGSSQGSDRAIGPSADRQG